MEATRRLFVPTHGSGSSLVLSKQSFLPTQRSCAMAVTLSVQLLRAQDEAHDPIAVPKSAKRTLTITWLWLVHVRDKLLLPSPESPHALDSSNGGGGGGAHTMEATRRLVVPTHGSDRPSILSRQSFLPTQRSCAMGVTSKEHVLRCQSVSHDPVAVPKSANNTATITWLWLVHASGTLSIPSPESPQALDAPGPRGWLIVAGHGGAGGRGGRGG